MYSGDTQPVINGDRREDEIQTRSSSDNVNAQSLRFINRITHPFPPSIFLLNVNFNRICINIGDKIILEFILPAFLTNELYINVYDDQTDNSWFWENAELLYKTHEDHYFENFIQLRRCCDTPGLYIYIIPSDIKKLLDNFMLSHRIHKIIG